MKKLFLIAFCLFSISLLHAQTFTAGHISATGYDTISHDSTQCSCTCQYTFSITIDSSYTGQTLYVIDTIYGMIYSSYTNATGVSPWTVTSPYAWGPVINDFEAVAGVPGWAHFVPFRIYKVATPEDTLRYLNFHTDSLYISNPCQYDTASGWVFIDNNNNCILDLGDVGVHQPTLNFHESLSSPAGSLNFGNMVNSSNGYYKFYVQKSWMINYSIQQPSYYPFIFPYSSCYLYDTAFTTLPQGGVDFPMQCTSNVDVMCYALSPASVRLHTPFNMSPYATNTGCDTVSGTLTFVLDHRVIYNPSLTTYPADTVRGDTLIWNYHSLNNLSGGAYWNSFLSDVYLTPDTTVVVGDTLCFRVYTNIPPADVNPANNDYSICLPVVYSYDPNSKQVSPAGIGTPGYIPPGTDTLTYTIHFQNTGSAAAFNVVIKDTLDSHILPKSLRVLGASASMMPEWIGSNVVQFTFNNINLPDSSTSFAASQGEVRFSVALTSSLPGGTQIKNKGYIYFDSNPPVITNTTINTIAISTYTAEPVTVKSAVVYPNPAHDFIVAENLTGGELSIINIDGEVLIRQSVTSDKFQIKLNSLPAGLYILKTTTNDTTSTTKLVKY